MDTKEILKYVFLGNTVLDYIIFTAIFLVGMVVVNVVKHIILKRLHEWAKKTATTIDDFLVGVIKSIFIPLAYYGVFYAGIRTLVLNDLFKKSIEVVGLALITLFVARLIVLLIAFGFEFQLSKKGKTESLERSFKGILGVVKLLVWALAVIFFLDNLGFKISTVIAGLGIGGIAVAMAAQAVLKDLFSYFCILFDRPFEVGDFIIIGDYLGAIEHIGIKTTRIRSLGGEQLIFSNTDLTNSRVRNYKRMEKRRVSFRLGATYQTPLEKLKEVPGVIENIIKGIEDTVFDRAHFFSFDDFSLTIEVVYYIIGSDYNKYMDIQQQINFGIKGEFEKRGIDFAYPTQTLYVNKEN